MDKIDFVMPWVDGCDKEWIALRCKYEASEGIHEANAECRYLDYGLLKYWFRAVDRFAPWVNRVFFVTCGQKPDWLDESNPKLRLVNHTEYIPSDYLPTFQSNTIELNLHRIADLSEHFVLFNDDLLLLRPLDPGFFFRKGLPVIPCDLGIPKWLGCSQSSRTIINNCGVLKQNLDVKHLIWKNIWNFADVRELGFARAAKNIVSFAVNGVFIPGTFGHLAFPHLKSTFDEIWQTCPRVMENTSRSRFRRDDGINHWLIGAWNMVSGRFYPANEKNRGALITVNAKNLSQICRIIRQQLLPEICLTDQEYNLELVQCFAEISGVFEELFPERSSFEKTL